jgi:hypothetical protein
MNIDVDLDSKHILYLLPLQRRGALAFIFTLTFTLYLYLCSGGVP